jgi:hypothetical protein
MGLASLEERKMLCIIIIGWDERETQCIIILE